ncbi:Mu transposase domain-containing protein [uncultured Arthrobacter sp.]|uniref:Mu transposase domain-containing protein n=1 Tax=uncultured Arthrobacter sp. TaxID=114050 RepID=UPI0026119E13|nr:hypothetical protein [uncultured Arthrobacter sp.]
MEWKQLKVGRNYHVSCDSALLGALHIYAGQLLRVRITSTTVTVFDGDQVLCQHLRRQGRKGQYSTEAAHAPEQQQNIDGLWSRQWFLDRARGFGPAIGKVIEQTLDRHAIEAQAYLDCQNILETLSKRNKQRLEAAFQVLLNNGQDVGSYSTIKRIMATIDSDSKRQKPPIPAAVTQKPVSGAGSAVHVRSAAHYQLGGQGAGA